MENAPRGQIPTIKKIELPAWKIILPSYIGTIWHYHYILSPIQKPNYFHVFDMVSRYEFKKRIIRYIKGCVVKAPFGDLRLSIPIHFKSFMSLKDIRILNNKWKKQHLRTFECAYNKTPFFYILKDGLFDIIMKPYVFLIDMGYPADVVHKVINMVERAEFKRYQSPPPIRINRIAWGKGWKMPLVGKFPR